MRKLCFGGSFNPIHHGHLICARAAAEAGNFSRVVLIPNAQPPLKIAPFQLAPAELRTQMCRLAVAGSDLFELDDLEMHRAGPSYTIDTVRELRRRGWTEVHWLIGADMLNLLPQWRQPDALLAEATLWVMARPGFQFDWPSLPDSMRRLESNVLRVPQIDISSTDIRNRVAQAKPIDYFTPPAVCDLIFAEKLYGPV